MASNVSVIYGQGRKQLVKTTPAMPLKNIVLAVCEKQKYPDVDSYGLKYGKSNLDLSLSVRFANLPAGAKLELVRTRVNVALQMDEGRIIQGFPTSTSYWDMLIAFEASSNKNLTRRSTEVGKSAAVAYLQPVCVYLNQEFGSISVLKKTTLQSTGITSGNIPVQSPSVEVTNQPTLQSPASPQTVQDAPMSTPPQAVAQPQQREVVQALPQSGQQPLNTLESPSFSQPSNPQTYQLPSIAREPRIFRPSTEENMAAKIELPDSFYELTSAELKAILDSQRVQRSKDENAPLKTRQMRENEELQKRRKYPRTLIRIRFPNRVQLQAHFSSFETISKLTSFVRESLRNPEWDFYLYVTPPIKRLTDPDLTLYEAGLTPASVVFFSLANNETVEEYLKEELVVQIEDLPSAAEATASSGPMDTSHPEPARNPSPVPREIHVPSDYDPEPRGKQEEAKKSKLPKWFKLGNK
ncbi:hypothetical protein K493DRAFT_311361 [Basidiobolus meristosporus CBS 931.73]|uniref:UBX domain-containing protein n=1 Tax=Basidiobolus meristosporus CBS 931.73 TaxID=1314790 RepID=A0A1Y1Z2V0_9FUNG|nr:hypothetical protein K493DRAFT_311361 [Basidiobolus meristosporus CBS 931.73]|eukprot:ORY04516.1 hypothetical protein K493DRAFT_311361 [Basidiobolus meristosporus CBS 931.73]